MAPIFPEDYEQALDDINATWGVLIDPKTGKQFEHAIVNPEADKSAGVDAELSTFTSSLSGNVGNAIELAQHGSLHPERQRLYLASFGNGKSSWWNRDEQRYIRQTGRYTQRNGDPLPTIAALGRALEDAELPITRFSTNSAGGAYATGLMRALPEGQVTHAYIKGRPNIAHHSHYLLWGFRFAHGNETDEDRSIAQSYDTWCYDQPRVDEAEGQMPRIYSADPSVNVTHDITEPVKTFGLRKILTDAKALSRGGDQLTANPAAMDTIKAIEQQPEMVTTFHFPLHDRLYPRMPADANRFLAQVHGMGQASVSRAVEALVMPGTHIDHKYFPALRWSVERYAFDRSIVKT